MQAFAIKKELANKTREAAGLQKTINRAEAKMKTLTDQAEEAKKAQDEAEEKADTAEAIAKVLAAEKKKVEAKMVEAQKELQDALAMKEAEIKVVDEKAYAEGAIDVREDYKKQVRHACNKGYILGWMDVLKALAVHEDSSLKDASNLVLSFPLSPISKDAFSQKTTSEVPIAERSIDQTLQEIDAELEAEKAAEKSSQLSSRCETQSTANID
ncbi:uncharacterized protein LOC114306988 [Camellia sinensis]|uniref:uncharacterized protein LOC114306988 n=1 Tax=Camellia sinensis TaxID=4442 RepID=UPI0010367F71|nr:uncharacterized protein LOC114306988 [Camellia sinensis]